MSQHAVLILWLCYLHAIKSAKCDTILGSKEGCSSILSVGSTDGSLHFLNTSQGGSSEQEGNVVLFVPCVPP